jgi:hypothetical protein
MAQLNTVLDLVCQQLFGFSDSQLSDTRLIEDEFWGFAPERAIKVVGYLLYHELPNYLKLSAEVLAELVDRLGIDTEFKPELCQPAAKYSPKLRVANPTDLIVLIGLSGAGKDTYGNHLVAEHNYVKLHFADALKRALLLVFNYTDNQMWGDERNVIDPRYGFTPRQSLQIFGTEVMRNLAGRHLEIDGESFWLKRIEYIYRDLYAKGQRVVVCDGRFPNENKFIETMGGIRARIINPTLAQMAHESERYILEMPVDYEINNDPRVNSIRYLARLGDEILAMKTAL